MSNNSQNGDGTQERKATVQTPINQDRENSDVQDLNALPGTAKTQKTQNEAGEDLPASNPLKSNSNEQL